MATEQLRNRNGAVTEVSAGAFLRLRSKTWLVEDSRRLGSIPTLDLVSVEDDSQGETLRVTLAPEIGARILGRPSVCQASMREALISFWRRMMRVKTSRAR